MKTQLPIKGQGPPRMWLSKKENVLKGILSFSRGDCLKATNASLGMEVGKAYPVLGYWNSEAYGMYAYIDATPNGMMKHYRFAKDENKAHEEVLFFQLPDIITEVCIQDCLFALDYVPAQDVEVQMWVSHSEAPGEPEKDNVIQMAAPQADKKGQFLIPFYQIA